MRNSLLYKQQEDNIIPEVLNQISQKIIFRRDPEANFTKIKISKTNSPFGECIYALTDKTEVIGIGFSIQKSEEQVIQRLTSKWNLPLSFTTDNIAEELNSVLIHGSVNQYSYQFHAYGTPFQEKVWKALLQIPYSECQSYQDIAHASGDINASRAVGNAVGQNPLSWLIPCHRVIRKNGQLGGFGWGLQVKEKMLNYENSL